MSRQVEIRVGKSCDHRRSKEKIRSEGGRVIAERCAGCHEILQLRDCKYCGAGFRLTDTSVQHGKIYCAKRCRQAAWRDARAMRVAVI